MKIIIGAHGRLGRELINSAKMIFGTLEDVSNVSLLPGMSFEDFKRDAESILKSVEDDQILVLTDLFGGTPCNVFSALSRQYGCSVVSGVNLPMLIELYASVSSGRDDRTAGELAEYALSVLRESGVHTNRVLASS
ncbi:PTS system fructose subfamily IIA component [Coriobacterium glomerans PW2]|uniref:PTS system fructose subfamily IIA component n=1 Tax=Coriobacterium glomerans (strain ATCC 49209 / DSM 20642 / JCM 10262 / PW2) TaxID=700015 RepID=F2NAW8_CORGP|nr:PTS system fructose subfamily transporter subunit IIA [Coriobacterium glomerans]AEB07646.1 PTS system fructose subfamily IIA component [Coriobacterium glomerans PW2]